MTTHEYTFQDDPREGAGALCWGIGITAAVLTLALVAFRPAPPPEPAVKWVGALVYAEKVPDGAFVGMRITIDKKYQVGLLEGNPGTVVFREAPDANE